MAPGLTWSNTGSDGGDMITAAATGGIAHPTGYPLYLLLARIFQLLPLGSLAFRTNLLSAAAAVLASVLTYRLLTHSEDFSQSGIGWVSGLISAFAIGLSPLVWSQAVITEVYTLHLLSTVFFLYMSSSDAALKLSQQKLDRLLGAALGLATGNHLTSILLFPILISPAFTNRDSTPPEKWKPNWLSLGRRLAWMGVGLLIYLTLPLRAMTDPPLNWGNPRTVSGFLWLVSGRLYQDQLFVLTPSLITARIQAVAGTLIEQFGVPGLLIGLIGLIVFFKNTRLFLNTIYIFFAFSFFAVVYATDDSYVYLIPAFLCFAVWIGLGSAGLLELCVLRFPRLKTWPALLLVLYIFMLAFQHWPQVDASRDLRAEEFGGQVLAEAPENALVFVKGDRAIFTMWYFHLALHQRTDLAVIVTDLLGFDWYQETLAIIYPDLILPGPFPFPEVMLSDNPQRPACFVEYFDSALIECSPAQISSP